MVRAVLPIPPQPDMDSLLISAGDSNDPKQKQVARGTAFSGYHDAAGSSGDDQADPYAPAESFLLRIGEDVEWSDVGAVLERDESTRGASNPKSAAATRKSAAARAPKAVASVVIGGLPKVAHEHGRRRACTLIGRERVSARADVEEEEEEPASPKVSCLGAVRSRRGLEPADSEAGRRGWRASFLAAVVRCWLAARIRPCKWSR